MNQTVWTIKSILLWTTAYLTKKHDEHPRLSAEILLSSVMGFSRVELYLHYDQVLDASQLNAMHQRVEARSQGKPLQYITGEMPFRHYYAMQAWCFDPSSRNRSLGRYWNRCT